MTSEDQAYLDQIRLQVGTDRKLLFERPPFDRPKVLQDLRDLGVAVKAVAVNGDDFKAYLEQASQDDLYSERYRNEFGDHFRRKALEHFVSFQLLGIDGNDVYMDVASSGSPVPEIVEACFNVRMCYRQDLNYEPGVHGNKIGSNGADIPLPDESVSAMALHCSIEHFEGDSDTGFIREAVRLMKPGGAVCGIPLYMSNVSHIYSNLQLLRKRGMPNFEPHTPIYMSPEPANHHGRFYSPETFKVRVADVAEAAGAECAVIDVVREGLDIGLGTDLAFLLQKPKDQGLD